MTDKTDILRTPILPRNVDVEYLNRSPEKLALLTIMTGGSYLMYWHYKNWQRRKLAVGSKISPIGRGIFNIFYCHDLFEKIHLSAGKHGYDGLANHKTLATAYVCIVLLGSVVNKFLGYIPCLIVYSCTLIPLMQVQRAIQYNNSQLGLQIVDGQETFTRNEKIFIILTTMLNLLFLSVWLHYMYKKLF